MTILQNAHKDRKKVNMPSTREEVVGKYLSLSERRHLKVDVSKLINLDPSVCADLRDSKCYKQSSYSSISEVDIGETICIGNRGIGWVKSGTTSLGFLSAVDLSNFKLKNPCRRRAKHIQNEIEQISFAFSEEIDFIESFTSALAWLEPCEDVSIGSAAFYEVPHCTFFSDMAMFSIPPKVILPEKYSGYAILENLYHEALHHQMHTISVDTNGYFKSDEQALPIINLDWRDRSFSLIEAFHALHVYRCITPMRIKYCKIVLMLLRSNGVGVDSMLIAIEEGIKMWRDLSMILLGYVSQFKSPYSDLIYEWEDECRRQYSSKDIREMMHGSC